MTKSHKKQILIKKAILNYLLNYFSPTNRLIIYLSQDLDKIVSKYQKHIYVKYQRRNCLSRPLRKVA
ncbi:hypothetical protein JCM1393_01140 [Clostridium carnis]